MSNNSSNNWIIRPFQPGDEKQAVPLFNRIFNKDMNEAEYLWKVVNTPWPPSTATTWIADDNGTIAGQYASTAMQFKLHNQIKTILHVCDVMTHPDYRKQGLLTTIGEEANRQWAVNNISFVTGCFPLEGWGSRNEHLGWEVMYQSAWMWRPLDLGQMLPPALKLFEGVANRLSAGLNRLSYQIAERRFRNWKTKLIVSAKEEFDGLWSELKHHYAAIVVRDSAWVNYRYLDAPHQEYSVTAAYDTDGKLCGYVACRLRRLGNKKVAYIADLFSHPEDGHTIPALLNAAILQMHKAGAQAILSLVPFPSFILPYYRAAGFTERYKRFNISIVPLDEKEDFSYLADPRTWYSSGGEFDLI